MVRVNEQIRISPIRLIDEEGNQVGVVEIVEALAMGDEKAPEIFQFKLTAAQAEAVPNFIAGVEKRYPGHRVLNSMDFADAVAVVKVSQ